MRGVFMPGVDKNLNATPELLQLFKSQKKFFGMVM